MSNGTNEGFSKIHLTKELPGGIIVKVFGDVPEEAVNALAEVMALIDTPSATPMTSAKLEIANAQNKAKAMAAAGGSAAPRKAACKNCSSQTLKTIRFTDKETGQPMSRVKCVDCNTWQ